MTPSSQTRRSSCRIALAAALALTAPAGCSSDSTGPLEGVDEIVFLQRHLRSGSGDIFQYNDYSPGARLVKLSPPTADGTLTVLCCDKQGAELSGIDIMAYDIAFDATEVVLSGRLSQDQRYGLFILSLEDDSITQLPTDPSRDYIYPLYLPGGRIMFMTNAIVEDGAPQFRDEYERGTTTQLGTIRRDGSDETLGARNLSHRVFPTLLADGRVMFTQWDHLGTMNAGHLMIVNPDMTVAREAFGKEGRGIANSYIKAVEIAPGRVVAIATSRSRTLQSGAIIEVRLGESYTEAGVLRADRKASERNSSYQLLTPQVPLGGTPSSETIGRYYDAYPITKDEYPNLLVSWADGPVESGTLGAAGLMADFGVYLYESRRGLRRPIWNDSDYWDLFPRPLAPRTAPPEIEPSGTQDNKNAVLIGSMNVYDSTIANFEPGSVYGVRVIEGFSSEEGIPNDFGLTEHEGAALLGVADVKEDGSWAAYIPPDVPVHQQVIDKFGMALQSEPVWISGRPGESRFCGGCHEDRAATTVIQPGITQAIAVGAVDLRSTLKRPERQSLSDFSLDTVVGVPWDQALQPLFDAKCVNCHNGVAGPANPQYTITDPETMETQTWIFDLSGRTDVNYGFGDMMMSGYSASHLSLLGPDMMDLEEAGLIVEGEIPIYVKPLSARDSSLIKKLNPPALYPAPDFGVRAFPGGAHAAEMGVELTADEYHLLILMADMGGQFYSRENAPNTESY